MWTKIGLGLLLATVVGGCTEVKIISPYDAQMDSGLQDFKQKLNMTVVDAAMHKFTPEGTFPAYVSRYAELEVQLAMLRDRAFVLEVKDVDCSVPDGLQPFLDKLSTASALLKSPPQPVTVASKDSPVPVTPVAIGAYRSSAPPAPKGCMTRLIENIAGQLTDIERIHGDPVLCAKDGLTCLRPEAARIALENANQSVDAALLVQVYKKESEAR